MAGMLPSIYCLIYALALGLLARSVGDAVVEKD